MSNLKWYLRLDHDLGDSRPEFIGPFPTAKATNEHKAMYGPVQAIRVKWDLSESDELIYSPEWHIEYLKRRD